MKKGFMLAGMIIITAALFSGCQLMDSIFYNTEKVEAKDLAAFSGSTPTNEAEAKQGLVAGMAGVSQANGNFVSARDLSKVLVFTDPAVAAMLDNEASRTISSSINKTTLPYTAEIKIDNETAEIGTGSATAELIRLSGKLNADNTDLTKATTIDARFDGEMKLNLKNVVVDSATTINSARCNLLSKGNAKVAVTPGDTIFTTKYKSSYYTATDLSFGFSISSTNTSSKIAGKYIVTMKYVNGGNLDIDMANASQAAESVSMEINVKLYDNTNTLANEFKLDQSDMLEFILTAMNSNQ